MELFFIHLLSVLISVVEVVILSTIHMLIINCVMDTLKKVMKINILLWFLLMKAKIHLKYKKNYGIKSEILLDQLAITEIITIRNI